MAKQEERLKKGEFTLDDFKKMLGQTKKLGPLNKVMKMIPGMGGMSDMLGDVDAEKGMKSLGGIIDSMTPEERRNPKKNIDQSRRRRIGRRSRGRAERSQRPGQAVRHNGRSDAEDVANEDGRPAPHDERDEQGRRFWARRAAKCEKGK